MLLFVAATGAGVDLIDLLPKEFLSDVGVVAIVLLVGWMLVTGRLVTRREIDALIEDRNYWREAFRDQQDQTQALMETGRVTRDVLRALPVPQQGEADDA